METLLRTSTLIQKNFWLCLMLVSLSLTFLGASQVTDEVFDRSARSKQFNTNFTRWCKVTTNNLPENRKQSFLTLSKIEKEQLFLNIR